MNFDLATIGQARSVVLVEGLSDKAALHALAARRGRDLGSADVAIVAMGGPAGARTGRLRLGLVPR
jgi:hypothetical protein